MNSDQVLKNKAFNLLVVIANYGQASKIIKYAKAKGANGATCFLGRGAIKSELLSRLALTAVKKEIIFIIVKTDQDELMLNDLNAKFRFDRPNHGIAFTLPLTTVLGYFNRLGDTDDTNFMIHSAHEALDSGYQLLISVLDRGDADEAIDLAGENGFKSGTIIDAHCYGKTISSPAQPEKDVVFQLVPSDKAAELAEILAERFDVEASKRGFIATVAVRHTIGLY